MKRYNFAVKNYIQRSGRTVTYDATFNHEALSSKLLNVSVQTECYPGNNNNLLRVISINNLLL